MEVISSKRFLLLTLVTSSLLTPIFCADELMMSKLHRKENYDKYSEPRGDLKGEKKRSLNFEELKDWGPKNVLKTNTPAVNKMPHSAANLPLRFGRTMEKESTRGMADPPLRFRGNFQESIWRRVPNLPQRFGRTTAKSVTKTLGDMLQQSMHSPSVNKLLYSVTYQLQESQNPDQKHPRRLGFQKIDDTALNQEK
ncbi:pro-FMRFamide-related neuropeptide VF [Pteropus alecto]|nr:pro-FMRFamide-related neuropeptide VF [Pteropus alecto]